LTCIQYH